MEPSNLALFWAAVIAVAILVYAVLDGFDLGVGMLFGTTRYAAQRATMMDAIAPYWDGNETWLVVIGASLYAAFPDVYAILLAALYVPVLLMLLGLIFRGIAFEFRFRSEGMRRFWESGFCVGSFVVAFVQGAAIGAILKGIPVVDGQFAGGAWDWLHPLSILTGLGLVLAYALLGAGWLMLKTEGEVREWAAVRLPWLVAAVLLVAGLSLVVALNDSAFTQHSLQEKPWCYAFAAIAVIAVVGAAYTARRQRDRLPFALTAFALIAGLLSLGAMCWPYLVPEAITVANAAAPEASLEFLFYGAIVVLPVIAVYTVGVYRVFRGKIRPARD